ncbi:hypothetical protein BFP76_02805 [Amylibacter kogurei]|uniref:Zn-dependent hydrolase n=1 Tax=Paramylibacter kogurei TaxID=1889778 RepID=A0A2G5K3Q6_9RHOB|nr:MBL fold metallo-hydrolase [Amylibacter kogurei]PIB24176.1 hypothetical protein BFP76_02805 [Amylibacter kogurei]
MKRILFGLSLLLAPMAQAERMPSHCLAFAERAPTTPIRLASTQLAQDEINLTFIDHSMYQIDTYGGLSVVTDFNGRVPSPPDVVTMNHAHSSHYTTHPHPDIKHVLRGWDPNGGRAEHALELDEMLIRNVTTDIRSGYTGIEPDGNSIFIFEVAGLCIGHLGHIHHEPTEEQYAMIGRLDVVMAPMDGGRTLDIPSMTRMLKRFRSVVVLPMHWFGRGTLETYLREMSDTFVIERLDTNAITLSLDTLPDVPTVKVLTPKYMPVFDE